MRVPLHPTGTNGEFVAGVRYRAWQPPTACIRRSAVHSPLVFDVFDTWNSRASAAAPITSPIPAAAIYERFPVNAYEAESRRIARFSNLAIHPDAWKWPNQSKPRIPVYS